MSSKLEIDSVILASGIQSRYGLSGSKLMAPIEDHPAFYYTMQSILEIIPEEFMIIISSHLFEDFNDYVSHNYQKARLLLNPNPGNGSAQTLKVSLPWQTREIFVTEGNIYYESYLISQLHQLLLDDHNLIAALSITPRVDIAPTHRRIIKGKSLDLSGRSQSAGEKAYRNIGAYAVRSSFQQDLDTVSKDIIEVLDNLSVTPYSLAVLEYYSHYLHMASPEDIIFWANTFRQDKKDEI